MSALARALVLVIRFLSEIGALVALAVGAPVVAAVYGVIAVGCALLVRYVGEPEPGATPAA